MKKTRPSALRWAWTTWDFRLCKAKRILSSCATSSGRISISLQKELIRHAHWHKKSAMVATQIMLSMVEKPHPTYAEVTDVANAVFDGADTLMLSDETSVGKFPLECVVMMKKIIDRADEYFNKTNYWAY